MSAFSVVRRRLPRRRNPNPPSSSGPPHLMGKRKPPKKPLPSKSSPSSKAPPQSPASGDLVVASACASMAPGSPSEELAQSSPLATDLAIISPVDLQAAPVASDLNSLQPVKVATATEPVKIVEQSEIKAPATPHAPAIAVNPVKITSDKPQSSSGPDTWADLVKGTSKPLKKKGTSFTLPSGEACVKIPNSVIERNMKTWDCFILGQFYSDPPSQGTIHNIANGIWSKHYRDIAVSKMEGNAFLFRIPSAFTRKRVLAQRLWQIEGQTMFVAKWDPGVIPVKPELTSAPIWLELRNVPLQFFHEEGLEHIAGLVGDPKALHPSTANKSNLEVAKVLTIIDPRKPLPEAVNVQFDSGEIRRVKVSSPWMPPVCSHCKGIGHSLRHCKSASITCHGCSSSTHAAEKCPKVLEQDNKKRRNQRRRRSRTPARDHVDVTQKNISLEGKPWTPTMPNSEGIIGPHQSSTRITQTQNEALTLGKGQPLLRGESNEVRAEDKSKTAPPVSAHKQFPHSEESEVEEDSSDVSSSDSDERPYEAVVSKWHRKALRGKCLTASS